MKEEKTIKDNTDFTYELYKGLYSKETKKRERYRKNKDRSFRLFIIISFIVLWFATQELNIIIERGVPINIIIFLGGLLVFMASSFFGVLEYFRSTKAIFILDFPPSKEIRDQEYKYKKYYTEQGTPEDALESFKKDVTDIYIKNRDNLIEVNKDTLQSNMRAALFFKGMLFSAVFLFVISIILRLVLYLGHGYYN